MDLRLCELAVAVDAQGHAHRARGAERKLGPHAVVVAGHGQRAGERLGEIAGARRQAASSRPRPRAIVARRRRSARSTTRPERAPPRRSPRPDAARGPLPGASSSRGDPRLHPMRVWGVGGWGPATARHRIRHPPALRAAAEAARRARAARALGELPRDPCRSRPTRPPARIALAGADRRAHRSRRCCRTTRRADRRSRWACRPWLRRATRRRAPRRCAGPPTRAAPSATIAPPACPRRHCDTVTPAAFPSRARGRSLGDQRCPGRPQLEQAPNALIGARM